MLWTRIFFGRDVMDRILETISRKQELHAAKGFIHSFKNSKEHVPCSSRAKAVSEPFEEIT